MPGTLFAGAARRIINPQLGHSKSGIRLFGDPIQWIESDLSATAVVLANGDTKVVIIGFDLCVITLQEATWIREQVAQALGIPVSHVLLNLSHNHSSPALPAFDPATSAEDTAIKEQYKKDLANWIVEAAGEADRNLQPARIGTGWGESFIGVYRREYRDGKDVLGEVLDHEIDSSVGVVRIDDLEGNAIATIFRYSAHPVSVGPRSLVASADYPGPARDVIEKQLGGLALFLQGAGGNINPRVGIGWEIDCSDTKDRVGTQLGAEVLKVASSIRTNRKQAPRIPLGNIPNILFTPWVDVEDSGEAVIAAADTTVKLTFTELPSLKEALAIQKKWTDLQEKNRTQGAQEWEIRYANKFALWAERLVEAVKKDNPTFDLYLQAIRVNDIIFLGMNVETFFETGLSIRAQSPFSDTFVLGYTNGSSAYLPRAVDYPEGGWKIDVLYAVPDLYFQSYTVPVALNPDSEQRAIDESLKLIKSLE